MCVLFRGSQLPLTSCLGLHGTWHPCSPRHPCCHLMCSSWDASIDRVVSSQWLVQGEGWGTCCPWTCSSLLFWGKKEVEQTSIVHCSFWLLTVHCVPTFSECETLTDTLFHHGVTNQTRFFTWTHWSATLPSIGVIWKSGDLVVDWFWRPHGTLQSLSLPSCTSWGPVQCTDSNTHCFTSGNPFDLDPTHHLSMAHPCDLDSTYNLPLTLLLSSWPRPQLTFDPKMDDKPDEYDGE